MQEFHNESDWRDPNLLHQQMGQFTTRYEIGPAQWPHFDLLWIHSGTIILEIGSNAQALELSAPGGVLIFPDVPFHGRAISKTAHASICHFSGSPGHVFATADGFLEPRAQDRLHVQNLIRLSLEYADRGAGMSVRVRLLKSILDCFDQTQVANIPDDRVSRAWDAARFHLAEMRSLGDVAGIIGLSESTFRSLHRETFDGSAGKYLKELRLSEAERLLSSTGLSVRQISKAVGYSHAESFSAAFKIRFGTSPGQFRRWSHRFA